MFYFSLSDLPYYSRSAHFFYFYCAHSLFQHSNYQSPSSFHAAVACLSVRNRTYDYIRLCTHSCGITRRNIGYVALCSISRSIIIKHTCIVLEAVFDKIDKGKYFWLFSSVTLRLRLPTISLIACRGEGEGATAKTES